MDRQLSRDSSPGQSSHSVFLTDSAVGTPEENNLRHLIANLGRELPRDLVMPFLTSKHPLDFCLSYAEQAWQQGFSRSSSLAATSPSAAHDAWSTRGICGADSRARTRSLARGWANPHASASKQVDFLLDERFCAEFYLTQVVSHLDLEPVKRFLDEVERRHVPMPECSASSITAARVQDVGDAEPFMPVPIEGLVDEFGAG